MLLARTFPGVIIGMEITVKKEASDYLLAQTALKTVFCGYPLDANVTCVQLDYFLHSKLTLFVTLFTFVLILINRVFSS